MREQDLAAVLFAQGVQSGLSMEQVIDELGAVNWPSFVDTGVFREALAEAAETQLRRQLDEQLAMIRRKIDVARPATPAAPAARATSTASQRAAAQLSEPVAVVAPAPESNGQASNATSSSGPATAPGVQTPAPSAAEPAVIDTAPAASQEPVFDEDDLPSDATMVWTTQHGERSDPE
jgi:hypothetical protein